MSLRIFGHASNDPEVQLRAHRTLTQKIAFDHHQAEPIDGSRVNMEPRQGKMAVQNVHSEDDAIITGFSKGRGTPNGTYGSVKLHVAANCCSPTWRRMPFRIPTDV